MSTEDKAQDVELAEWERNQQRTPLKTYQPGETGYGPEECTECAAPMPALRRTNGCERCTACQSEIERLAKRSQR